MLKKLHALGLEAWANTSVCTDDWLRRHSGVHTTFSYKKQCLSQDYEKHPVDGWKVCPIGDGREGELSGLYCLHPKISNNIVKT